MVDWSGVGSCFSGNSTNLTNKSWMQTLQTPCCYPGLFAFLLLHLVSPSNTMNISSNVDPGAMGRTKASRKRKPAGTTVPSNVEVVDLTGDNPTPAPKHTPRAKKQRREGSNPHATPERRLRRFRPYPPASCMDRLHRSRTQRCVYQVARLETPTDGTCAGCMW